MRGMTAPSNGAPPPVDWMKSVRALAAEVDQLVRDTVGLAFPPVDEALAQAGRESMERLAYCPKCGDSIGEGEHAESGCATCRAEPALADRVVRLGTYDGPLRELILAVKFKRWWEMGHTLGRLLGDCVASELGGETSNVIVVPVPMPWQRRMFRGIDHARVIASGVAESLRAETWHVLRKLNGDPQLAMTSTDRKRAGGRGLRIRPRLGGWPLQGRRVVLVDDVRTTGATIRRAVRLLRRLGPAEVTAAVVAVADHASRRKRTDQSRPMGEAVDNPAESSTPAASGS